MKSYIISLIILVMFAQNSLAAETGTITGFVTDIEGKRLAGANIIVVGTTWGAAADLNGNFKISYLPAGNYTVKASMIGYKNDSQQITILSGETVELSFNLSDHILSGQEITVYSASRKAEKMTDAASTVSVLGENAIRRSAGFVFGEAISKSKGVDFYRTGVDGIGVNARGFMTAFSYRFQVFADGRNSMLPGASVGPGNLLPVAKEDIKQVEMIIGPSSALYGPNASNGLLNVITKHPRNSQGTTLVVGGGQNSTKILRARHAGVFKDKISYKFNVESLQAEDWVKNDTVEQQIGFATIPIGMEDPDFNIKHLRYDGSLYYSLNTETDLIATYAKSTVSNIITTNVGRNQVVDWTHEIQQLRYKSPHLYMSIYRTGSGAGGTHSINNKVLWMSAGFSEEAAIDSTTLIDKSARYNGEIQYNNSFGGFDVIMGLNYEDNRPVTDGTFIADTAGRVIHQTQFGIYTQIEKNITSRLKFVGAARYDTQNNYDPQFSPRIAALFSMPGYGTFRLTFNRAYQAPAVLQQELYVLVGANAYRGNLNGFTLSDGTEINKLNAEISQSVEAGYRGKLAGNIYMDANAYYTVYTDFISPLTLFGNPGTGAYVTHIGGKPLNTTEQTYTYMNFGEVSVAGFDAGGFMPLSKNMSINGSISIVKALGLFPTESDTAGGKIWINDVDKDGDTDELSFNTPELKYNFGISFDNIFIKGFYASFSMRHVSAYDFISGSHRATEEGKGTGPGPFQDRGALGGFNTFDLFLGYNVSSGIGISFSLTNILDTPLREFVGSPTIQRMAVAEVRYTF